MKWIAVAGLALLFGAACRSDHDVSTESEPDIVDVESLIVPMDTVTEVVPVDGSVEARREATLATRMMATVATVTVNVGDRVRAGEVLITLGTEDVEADRARAEAAVAAATAARDEAAKQVARMDTLYAQDVVPLVRRDEARLQLTVATSQMTAAESALRQAISAEQYAVIEAPFGGTIVQRHINPGDLAVPGVPLLNLAADGPREAVLGIPAYLMDRLSVGSQLTIEAGAFGSVTATVRAIASGADVRSRTVEVRAELPAAWPTGISVTALVPGEERTVATVPLRAVVRRGQLTGVRVVTDEGLFLRWIRLGRQFTRIGPDGVEETWLEVLSGLEPGERIAS